MLKKLMITLFIFVSVITFSEFDGERFFQGLFHKTTVDSHLPIADSITLSEGGRAVPLGISYDQVLSSFGDPVDVLESEYGFFWNIYHENFQNYIQIGVAENRVVGLYTNSPRFSFRGITVGTAKEDVHLILETPVSYIVKDRTKYTMNGLNDDKVNMELFDEEGMYITLFYDTFKNNSVTAIHIIEYETEQSFQRLHAVGSDSLRESFEKQNFYVTNALRVREGLPALFYHEEAEEVAKLHSAEMADNGYFSHTDLSGGNVADRLKKGNVSFQIAGENIAMGAQSTLFMHELLMNSEGHRKNILADYKEVAMGVAFSRSHVPYLTQNFIG